MKMKKIVPKVTRLSTQSKSKKINSTKLIEKENKTTKNSKLNNKLNRNQTQSIGNKKSKQKQSKWKFGIIVKQKTIITRSIARRLIDKNLLDLDREYLVLKEQHINNRILNDDVLKLVFGYLSLKDRFRIQRTSKQFYAVLQEMLSEQMALRIGEFHSLFFVLDYINHI